MGEDKMKKQNINLDSVKSYGLVAAGLFLVFMGCMRYQNEMDIPKEDFNQPAETVPVKPNIPIAVDPETGAPIVDAKQILPAEYKGVSEAEKQSMAQMLGVLLKFGIDDKKSYQDFHKALTAIGVDPWVSRTGSPEEASMYFVRTKKRLPGVKNIHAQFMRDGWDGSYAQHISFDFRPSESSFKLAADALRALYPNLGAPKLDFGSGIKSWTVDNGMHIYIRTIDQEFLSLEHLFNAYGPEDLGVIRVVIEEDIEEL